MYFIKCKSIGHETHINAEKICYFKKISDTKTSVVFDDKLSIEVDGSIDELVDAVYGPRLILKKPIHKGD